jgi:SAM-dependent methyltransferase
MGDNRRFVVFADFIKRNFPNACHVADIGGGSGLLSLELVKRGYQPTVFEPSKNNSSAAMRRAARKRCTPLQGTQGINRSRLAVGDTRLCRSILEDYDLLVGMHPDEATEIIVRLGLGLRKPFAVVPCCVMPLDGRDMVEAEWIKYLQNIGRGVRSARLGFSGKNVVLFKR